MQYCKVTLCFPNNQDDVIDIASLFPEWIEQYKLYMCFYLWFVQEIIIYVYNGLRHPFSSVVIYW